MRFGILMEQAADRFPNGRFFGSAVLLWPLITSAIGSDELDYRVLLLEPDGKRYNIIITESMR